MGHQLPTTHPSATIATASEAGSSSSVASTRRLEENPPSTREKALTLNLGGKIYGTFAEIGAGQEVARWFFSVGGASGTVAETISAYDMAVSDAIYGPTPRYVSRQRLESMLEHEFQKLRNNLNSTRGDSKRFFAFADTVTTVGYNRPGPGRGWLGIRFQSQPHEEPSQVIIHAHLRDSTAVRQQESLGVLGVNLIFGAFHWRNNPAELIASLSDKLSREHVEIDMVKFSGPAFQGIDNRLMSLQLVELGLTDAAMFTAQGEVVQPSEVLYRKPILVERGSFRPATKLTLDLLERARDQFLQEPRVHGQVPVVLAEMTLRSLNPEPDVGHADFLARANILRALGFDVLVSRFEKNYQLADYLSAYTNEMLGFALGLPAIREIFNDKYYRDLPGGLLESAGRLFKQSVRMYVYPTRDPNTGRIETLDAEIPPQPWQHLLSLLLETGHLEPILDYNESYLSIRTLDVLRRIEDGDVAWEQMVPATVMDIIKSEKLFGWSQGRDSQAP